jgi:hypothetical protein
MKGEIQMNISVSLILNLSIMLIQEVLIILEINPKLHSPIHFRQSVLVSLKHYILSPTS